jgi:hypothetical protein
MINIDVKMVFREQCKESASLCRDMLGNLPTGWLLETFWPAPNGYCTYKIVDIFCKNTQIKVGLVGPHF